MPRLRGLPRRRRPAEGVVSADHHRTRLHHANLSRLWSAGDVVHRVHVVVIGVVTGAITLVEDLKKAGMINSVFVAPIGTSSLPHGRGQVFIDRLPDEVVNEIQFGVG